jgi:hypothetical protein
MQIFIDPFQVEIEKQIITKPQHISIEEWEQFWLGTTPLNKKENLDKDGFIRELEETILLLKEKHKEVCEEYADSIVKSVENVEKALKDLTALVTTISNSSLDSEN